MKSKRLLLLLLLALVAPWAANAQKALPYSYGFENNDLDAEGWTVVTGGSIGSSAHTGSYGFTFSFADVSSADAFLMSPILTGGTNGIDMSFWYKAYSSSYLDHFQVGYTTDETVTDPSLFTYYPLFTSTTSWSKYENSLPAGTVRVAIKYDMDNYDDGWYLYIDDFTFEVPAACPKPTDLAVSNTAARSATLNWTSGAANWQICVNGDETNPVNASTNPYTLTNLNPDTHYTVKVRANCGADGYSEWSNEISFNTEEACLAPTSLAISDITPYAANASWTGYSSNYDVRYGLYQSTASTTLQYDNGTYATSIGTGGGHYYWATMYPVGMFSGNFVTKVSIYDVAAMTGTLYIYNDGETAPSNLVGSMNIEFTGAARFVDFTFDEPVGINSNKNLWIVVYNESGATYPSAACNDDDDIANNRWISFDNVTWEDLADAGVPGYGWMIRAEVETVPVNGTVYTSTSNTYALTDLDPATQYVFQVRSNCGGEDGVSAWTSVAFTTLATCIAPEGLAVSDITARDATFTWTAAENVTFQYCYVANPAEGYIPADEEFRYETTENTVTLTHTFTPDTDYVFYLRKKCTNTDFSDHISVAFHTDVACHTPTALAVTPESTSATANWTGDTGNFDVRYGLYPESTSQEWLSYGITQSSFYGSSSANSHTWGVKYRRDEITGNILSKIEFYESSYNSDGYTIINVYSGGDNAPGTLLYTELINPEATGLQTVTLAQPVNIASGENLWITLTEYGTFTLSVGACTDDDNRWILQGSAWTTWGVAGYGWIINGYMETVDFDSVVWTDDATTENMYAMTGLNPETQYIFQVRSNCGGEDGVSPWATYYFTTLPSCAVPTNIEVTTTTTTATIGWTNGTSDQTAWQICLNGDEQNLIDANTNPYTIENLTSNTTYTIKVRAYCGEDEQSEWSDEISFTTDCATIATLPWNENFESFGNNTVPTCWDNSASSSTTLSSSPYYIWGVYDYNGNKMIRMENYWVQTGTALINSPVIELPSEGEYELTFDYAHNASCGDFTVKISEDGGVTFTDLSSYSKGSGSSHTEPGAFTEANISLKAYAGRSVILQFFANANYGNGAIFVDNIKISLPPTCLKPTDLEVTATTATTATLSWTNGTEDQTAWQICLNGDEENLIMAESNPFILENLTASTAYTAKVRAYCSADDQSDWSNEVSFATECETIVVTDSWSEDFEDGSMPVCWSQDGDGTWTVGTGDYYTTTGAHTGTYNAMITHAYSGYVTKLITPVLDITSLDNPTLNFWYINRSWSGDTDGFAVYYRTASDAEWTLIEATEEAHETWTEATYTLPEPSATYQIAFEMTDGYGYGVGIDDVTVSDFVPSTVTQTLELTEGWNWISSYIEMDDPIDLLLMLEEGLNGNGTVIKNADYTTSYEDEEWFGDLDDEGIMNEQMYKVYVIADCEVELQGMPADPANHTITIVHGWNWIGFPCSETVSIEDALADFEAEEGDILKTSESTTNFEDGEWFGDIEEMVPGQGYMYYSNSEEEKELTFLTGAKARRNNNLGKLKK